MEMWQRLHACFRLLLFLIIAVYGPSATSAAITLGTTNLIEGPVAGMDSVVLSMSPVNAPWMASANVAWLHLSADNQSGSGSTNVVFSFDGNVGAPRTGTLTIAGQTLTVTQAGTNYLAAGVCPLVTFSLPYLDQIAVDRAGNIYAGLYGNGAPVGGPSGVQKWVAASNTIVTAMPEEDQVRNIYALAVNDAGDIYLADDANVYKWAAASNALITLPPVPLVDGPIQSLALDSAGNVFIGESYGGPVYELRADGTVTVAIPDGLFFYSTTVGVDAADNLYVVDTFTLLYEWKATGNTLTTLDNDWPYAYYANLTVDGSGNIYQGHVSSEISEWVAATQTQTTPVTGLDHQTSTAMDGAGNLYIAEEFSQMVSERPRAFINASTQMEPAAGGGDSLPPVVPATANLTGPLAPMSDSVWLTITGVTNGVVSYTCAPNPLNAPRTAHISLLGQSVTVSQSLSPLNSISLLEGPAAGSDLVVIQGLYYSGGWTAVANDSWLHISAGSASGTGVGNVFFSFDANAGATRTGTLTVAGQPVTVTQAGSTYIPAGVVRLFSYNVPNYLAVGLAVDSAGNLYLPDTISSAIVEWIRTSNTFRTLISGMGIPQAVALDSAGNVYALDRALKKVVKWNAASNTVTTVITNIQPVGLALDSANNIYFADATGKAIREWIVASNQLVNLITNGLTAPAGVALDGAENVYILDGRNSVKEWLVASNTLITLFAPGGIPGLDGLAVDSFGNVYTSDPANEVIKEWSAASHTLITVASSGADGVGMDRVAVDAAGNVYSVIFHNGAGGGEVPKAYLDSEPRYEGASAGSDSLLPVLPTTFSLTSQFAPSSDSPWLTMNGVVGSVINFSFATNSGLDRPGNITLFNRPIPVLQKGNGFLLSASAISGSGTFQFSFLGNANSNWMVLTSTNVDSPLTNWTVVGPATYLGGVSFQVLWNPDPNETGRYFIIRSP